MNSTRSVSMPPPVLKALTVTPGPLKPNFWNARTRFGVYVPHTTEAVVVTAETDGAEDRIALNGGVPQAGTVSATVRLAVGRTMIPLEVTGPGGTTRYSLRAVRAHPTPDWEQTQTALPWSPRDSAGELVLHDRLWLCGGYTPALVNDVWSSTDGATWTQTGTLPSPSGVNIPVTFAYRDRLWVASQEGHLFASRDGADWTLVTDQAPWKGRYAAGSAVFAGKMWVMGGFAGGRVFNDVWSSTDGVQWTLELEQAPWSARQLFGMLAVRDDTLWLLGGGITVYHPFRAYTDVWRTTDGRHWTPVTDAAPWPARIWSSSAVYRNRLWVFGGFRAEPTWNNFNDVWYSSDGAQWHPLATETIWSPRHEVSAYVFDDALWVFGGNAWPLLNDAWRLRLPTRLTFVTAPVVEEFVGARYTYRARADFNALPRPVRYRLCDAPPWLTMQAESGLIQGIPPRIEDVPITIEARDEAGETARQSYVLHVTPVE